MTSKYHLILTLQCLLNLNGQPFSSCALLHSCSHRMMKMGSFLDALTIGKMLIFSHMRFGMVFPLQARVRALELVEGLVLVLILGEEVELVVEVSQVLVPPLVAMVVAVLEYFLLSQLPHFPFPSLLLIFLLEYLEYLLFCHCLQCSIYALALAKQLQPSLFILLSFPLVLMDRKYPWSALQIQLAFHSSGCFQLLQILLLEL